MLRFAFREARMVKNDFGAGTLFPQFELHNGIDTGIPIHNTPRLDNSLIGHELDLPAHDMATEKGERATHLLADFCGPVA
jgi:hypothetical protein